jgi:hypothetical protein
MGHPPDSVDVAAPPGEQAADEANDTLDWDLDERDRYMAEHEDAEEAPEVDVLVKADG